MSPIGFCILSMLWIVCGAAGHVLKRSTEASPADGSEITCHCDLPACISTSYMCKTESGCFKMFDLTANRYDFGCLDSVTKLTICPKEVEITSNNTSISLSRNQCCYTDMCNDETVGNSKAIAKNDISLSESDEEEIKKMLSISQQKNVGKISSMSYYTNSEIWFRAVLIAVPICGLMILLILIFIAVRILRSDSLEDRISSSKLIKQNYEISAVSGAKLAQSAIPQTYGFHCEPKPKYSFFDRKFPFMFKQYPEKHCSTKNAKYQFMSRDKSANNLNIHGPKVSVSEKFSRPNLNILKFPYKFNELKPKNGKNVNVNANSNSNNNNNNHGYSLNDSVTLNTNSSYVKKI